jgi:hypothetical protein
MVSGNSFYGSSVAREHKFLWLYEEMVMDGSGPSLGTYVRLKIIMKCWNIFLLDNIRFCVFFVCKHW